MTNTTAPAEFHPINAYYAMPASFRESVPMPRSLAGRPLTPQIMNTWYGRLEDAALSTADNLLRIAKRTGDAEALAQAKQAFELHQGLVSMRTPR